MGRYVVTLKWEEMEGIAYCRANTLVSTGEVEGLAYYTNHMAKVATENAAVIEIVKQLPTFTHLEIVRL